MLSSPFRCASCYGRVVLERKGKTPSCRKATPPFFLTTHLLHRLDSILWAMILYSTGTGLFTSIFAVITFICVISSLSPPQCIKLTSFSAVYIDAQQFRVHLAGFCDFQPYAFFCSCSKTFLKDWFNLVNFNALLTNLNMRQRFRVELSNPVTTFDGVKDIAKQENESDKNYRGKTRARIDVGQPN
jgi:hypothetical protein